MVLLQGLTEWRFLISEVPQCGRRIIFISVKVLINGWWRNAGAKLLSNGLENVTFTGRQLETAS